MPRMLCPTVIGRDVEIERLRRAVHAALQGSGGLIVLTGPAGIGKSRLVAVVAGEARARGAAVLRGRAVPSDVPDPYRPLAEALAAASREGALPDAEGLEGFGPALGRLVPQWRDEGAPAEAPPVVVAEALVRALRILAGGTATVLLIEDLHWADPETLHAVEYLADHTSRLPVLCVATARDDAGAPGLELARRLEARNAAALLALPPLDGAAVAAMAAACLEVGALSADVARWLETGAEGNPFLVEELLAAAVATRSLVQAERGWTVAAPMAPLVPESLADSVRRRVAAAGPQARTILALAAILGRAFDWRLVAAAAEDGDAVPGTLTGAVALQILEVTGGDYRFRHALTRDAILLDLLPHERAALAARALAALETAPPAGEEWRPAAAELAEVAGDAEHAAGLLLGVGRTSLARGALDSATAALGRAARLTREPSLRAEAQEALAEARAAAGDLAGTRSAVSELLATLDELGASPRRRGGVHLLLARSAIAATDFALASESLAQARRLGAAAADAELGVRVAAVAAELALLEGRGEEAAVLAERAAAEADDLGLTEVGCAALEVAGRWERTRDLDRAEALFSRALRAAEEARMPMWQLRALYQLGTVDLFRTGDVTRLERARELAQRLGAVSTVAHLDLEVGAGYEFQCRHDEALAAFARCVERAELLGIRLLLAYAWMFMGVVEATRSRTRMEEHLERAMALGGDDRELVGAVWGDARAVASLAQEDRPRALRELDRAAEAVGGHHTIAPRPYMALRALLTALEGGSRGERGDMGAAMVQVGAYLAFADAVAHGRAGRRAEAEESLRRGDELLAGSPWYRHLLHRLCAEAAMADGWGEPATWLREASAHFDGSGNPRLASACRDLLRRTGARVARPTAVALRLPAPLREAGVTGREAEVLALVGEGLSNAAIAARLFLSERTVEHHVSCLRRKLSLDSRARMAAYAVTVGAQSA